MQEIKRCKKPGLPERVRTNTQAVLRLAWGGLAKGNQSVQQAQASVVSQKSPGGHLPSQGYGAWGPGSRQAKGWLKRLARRWGPGGKRARDTPPTPPPPPRVCKGQEKRVFVTETIGRRMGYMAILV